VAQEGHEISLCLDGVGLGANVVNNATLEKCSYGEVSWLRVIEMGGYLKQIDGFAHLIQKVGATQIINAKPEVMQELAFPDVRAETDVRKPKDAMDRIDSVGGIVRTFQEVEQTQYHGRRKRESSS
jgi:hypothetical protein